MKVKHDEGNSHQEGRLCCLSHCLCPPLHFPWLQVLGQQAAQREKDLKCHTLGQSCHQSLPFFGNISTREKIVIWKPFHKALNVYEGDFGILTNRTMFLEHFRSRIFPVVEVIGAVLSLVNALENAAFPVCFTGWNLPFCPSITLDSAPILWPWNRKLKYPLSF